MALQKTIIFKGVSVPDAYIKIIRFDGDKSSLTVGVGYFASPEHEMLYSDALAVPYAIDGSNPIQQAYEYLKTLPEFADAVDC